MTNEPSVPRPITSSALRSLSLSQRGTTHMINRVQRAADRATAFNAPRLTTGARSLNEFSSRIADRFPPIAAKYETHAMAAKPRQDMPLAEVNVPSLSPVDTPLDLPAVETAAREPFAATSSALPPGVIQRRPAAANSAAANRAAPTPIAARAITTDSVATTRLQRAVEATTPPTTASEGDSPIDRTSLPSITSQLRQMRPATMPKPKEAAPAEPISYNLPPTVQRASEPADSTSPVAPAPAPTMRPAPPTIQAEGTPRLRRVPRAQITEVTARTTESAISASTPSIPEIAQDIAPEAARPTPISSTPLPPLTVARTADVSAPTSAAVTPLLDAVRSAPQIEPQDSPPVASSPMSPRQLARLFSAARPSVQRQVEATSQTETPSQVQPPVAPPVKASQTTVSRATVSPEETRVRRFVETVQREARAFTGQVGEQGSEIRDQEPGIGDQAEAVQRAPEPTPTTNQPKAVPPSQLAPQIQRTPDQTGEIESAPSVTDQAASPVIQRPRERTNVPHRSEVLSPTVAQSAALEPTETTAPLAEPDQVVAPGVIEAPRVQRAPDRPAAPDQSTVLPIQPTPMSAHLAALPAETGPTPSVSVIQRAEIPEDDWSVGQKSGADAEKPTISATPEAILRSPAPFSGEQSSSETAPTRTESLPTQMESLPPQTESLPFRTESLPPQMESLPTQTESLPTQTESLPTATVQRAIAPEADRGVAAPRGESVTAQLRQRIADQAVQRREAEPEPSAPQAAESVMPLEAASPIQPATARTAGEARLQRMPDLPLIQRAQADRSDAEKPSAAPPERKPPATIAPVERIQRTIEPGAVSSAPANRVQRVLGEASGSGAAIDLDQLAREVYPIVKRMIAIERERRG